LGGELYCGGVPVPQFILDLRAKIGHDPLWLCGVTAVVLDERGDHVLLTRRADNGLWSLVSGILEPGEQPAVAVAREIAEETGVEATVERLASVLAQEPMLIPNGDQCQFLDLCFRCRYVSGEARVADDENLDVRWWALSDLPEMEDVQLTRIQYALEPTGPPYFER